jgi:hypothetical protein
MYLAVAAAPLVFALVGDTPPGRDFLTDSPSPSSRVWCAG